MINHYNLKRIETINILKFIDIMIHIFTEFLEILWIILND